MAHPAPNSVFHLCDMWSLVTGDRAFFFNPQAPRYLPGSTQSSPGRAFKFCLPNAAQYRDQWSPFVLPQVAQGGI